MKEVYIVKNDYKPDPGTWIYGIYNTLQKAKNALAHIQSGEEKEYEFTEEEQANFEISCEYLE